MGWEDYVFEDPMESYERGLEEDSSDWEDYDHEEIERRCKKCQYEFLSAYPSACPECGGWTDEIDE